MRLPIHDKFRTMKIDKKGLHPLFDQYENAENRLTHALLHTIGSSNLLFRRFLRDLMRIDSRLIAKHIEISTQKEPLSHGDKDPDEIESIPDAWIVDGSSKAQIGIAVEVKDKKNALKAEQLRKHANRIRNYSNRYLLVLTPDLQKPGLIHKLNQTDDIGAKVIWLPWNEIYRWLAKMPFSKPSTNSKEAFLIVSLREFLERRREVLGFQGISFPRRFDVAEAKDILNAEMEELEYFVKELYLSLDRRRPAITTFSQESVWDCFGSNEGFTTDLHFTLAIHENWHDISLVVPNSAGRAWLRLKSVFSSQREYETLFSILKSLRENIPYLFIEFHQRHFVTRRFGVRDGFMEFNVDTLGSPFRRKNSKTKEFPIWVDAIGSAVKKKGNVNGQVMFKSRFFLQETAGIEKPEFIETSKQTIKAFKPLYEFLKG